MKTENEHPTILISACLLGCPCRYDGRSKGLSPQEIAELREDYRLVPICPESQGGLPTPRPPAEIQADGRVRTEAGTDVTPQYQKGAAIACELAREHGARAAVLMARSPSCGVHEVYDGSFTGTLRSPAQGVAARALSALGLPLVDADPRRDCGKISECIRALLDAQPTPPAPPHTPSAPEDRGERRRAGPEDWRKGPS